jgi:hypothetical protein
VPASNVTFGGEAARTLTATAVSGRTGTAVLTVTVSDGGEVKGTVNVRVMVDGNGSSTTDGTAGAEMIFGQNGATR